MANRALQDLRVVKEKTDMPQISENGFWMVWDAEN